MSAQVMFHRTRSARIEVREHNDSRWLDLYFIDDEGVESRIVAFLDQDSEAALSGEIIKEKEVA